MARGKPVFTLDLAPLNEIQPKALRSKLVAEDDDGLVELIAAFVTDRAVINGDTLRAHIDADFGVAATASAYARLHASL